MQKCGPKDKGTEQTRYFYVNNVPLGKNPISGSNYKDFRGLIPGMLQNIDVLNPGNVASAFLSSSTPDCMEITLDTIDSTGTLGNATHYVSLADIAELDPCLFPDRVNPQTKAKCSMEGFESMHDIYMDQSINMMDDEDNENESESNDLIQEDIKKDYISQLFLSSFSLLGIYILFLALKKFK